MYKDSNFFFRLLASFVSLYSFSHPLILSLSFSPSLLSLSLIRSLLLPHTHTRTQSSFFLSFLSHPPISIIQLQTNTLSYPPLPLFLSMHLFLSFTRSHDRGQEVEVRELRSLRLLLRHRYEICINDEIKSDLSNYE